MKIQHNIDTIEIKNNKTSIKFLETGDIREILGNDILINQVLGNCLDGSLNNLYLRVYEDEQIKTCHLLGNKSNSKFLYNEKSVKWLGEALGIKYQIVFNLLSENIWAYNIELEGNEQVVDVLYAQDISLGNKGGTLTNELYMCQYIDHKILKGENGYVISSRQNLSQSGKNPYLQQGAIGVNIIGFSTDGMQFFGKSYKETNEPEFLIKDLQNKNYQYEMAYTVLQTEKITLNNKKQFSFYNIFKEDYKTAVEKIDFEEELKQEFKNFKEKKDFIEVNSVKKSEIIGDVFVSDDFTQEEINKYFKNRILEEKENGKLLSFFDKNYTHIVLKQKELLVERPHGHIITTALNTNKVSEGLITSTNYMYGVFNSQLVVGNTSLNKMLSTIRSKINTQKTEGQRIYIKLNNKYQLLTIPAAYELGVNYAKWYYKISDDVIIIKTYAVVEQADIVLEISSEKENKYEFIITNQLVMGEHEHQNDFYIEQNEDVLYFKPEEKNISYKFYPELHYKLQIRNVKFNVSNDSMFYKDNKCRNSSFIVFETEPTNQLQCIIAGRLYENKEKLLNEYIFEEEVEKYNNIYKNLSCNFRLQFLDKEEEDLYKVNTIFWWYTHNAMIHYSVPHGLEQPGGAAWGTRDICQGPIEYFFATRNYKMVKEIIKEIFAHQFFELGEWPQWFMFDKYLMQQDDCHGDVVFWPLKVVSDYLIITGDIDILNENIVYRHTNGNITEFTETVKQHIIRAIETIKNRFLYNTSLISYAGGDWDDTLQPANKQLKNNLVSAWTVALAYQSLNQLGNILEDYDNVWAKDLQEMSNNIKNDFNKLLIEDDIIAGFVYYKDANTKEYMLHPKDEKTGIKYRLLPMTRSIISELVTRQQANKNLEIINKYLKFPDGVRLMNTPAKYEGGVSKFFQRAEQATNVGREISLNYIHAHIRYIEAIAKIGDANEAWEAMMIINPILIKNKVKNATIRQSNTYFSSSDGAFYDRYEYQEDFNKLRTGEIDVKGGWRIYSSGPGIYLNQIVSNILGIRQTAEYLILDPILSSEKDGLILTYDYYNKPTKWYFHILKDNGKIEKVIFNDNDMPFEYKNQTYRNGGVEIEKNILKKYIKDENEIHIYIS